MSLCVQGFVGAGRASADRDCQRALRAAPQGLARPREPLRNGPYRAPPGGEAARSRTARSGARFGARARSAFGLRPRSRRRLHSKHEPAERAPLRRRTSWSEADANCVGPTLLSIWDILHAAMSSLATAPLRGQSEHAVLRFWSMRLLCASRRFRWSSSGIVAPRPKYISSGVWPRKALCGIVVLRSVT